MANLIDWNALIHKCKSYIGESDYATTEKRAFPHIVLEYLFSLSPEEITDSITDGSNDRGVDAVYIDDRDDRNVIHLFQFKHTAKFAKAKNHFPSNEIDKILSFCSDLLNESDNMEDTCNTVLWKKVQDIWFALERENPSFCIHFCGNMKSMMDMQRDRIQRAVDEYGSFSVRHHSLDSIVQMFLEKKRPKIDATLQAVDKNYFERTDGNIRGLICTFEATEIIRLITDPDDPTKVRHDAFNDNVRIYLTQKNNVNKKIFTTALSEKNSEFWYLNNGITLTCDTFSYQPAKRSPKIALTNVQIVNGGQTSNALFEANRKNPEKVQDVLVLGRIYETRTRDITSEIAEATNSQTPINTRDLHSNDDIQKKLEEGFSDQGLFYERKYRQHWKQPKKKRVDALTAGQALLAYSVGYPEVAKKDRARVFRDLYDNIFNEECTTQILITSLRLYETIQEQKRELQKKIRKKESFDTSQLFLIDGGYHVLFAVYELCEAESVDPFDLNKAKKLIPEAIKLVKDLVNAEIAADETFSTNRYFKDAKTKSQVQRKIALRPIVKKKIALTKASTGRRKPGRRILRG
ncbi:MAG: AIPR family protein [Nitrospiria bacterium]